MRFSIGFVFVLIAAIIGGEAMRIRRDAEGAATEAVLRAQRQIESGGAHHDAVDFGAHTGDHGAFGWYADFPVHSGH